jgi:hypothetical protein
MHEVIAENSCNAMKQKVYARRRKCQSFHPVPKISFFCQIFITLMQIIGSKAMNHVHHFNI